MTETIAMVIIFFQVVQRIRGGDGKGRKFLVIDQQTEKEMKARVGYSLHCLQNLLIVVF